MPIVSVIVPVYRVSKYLHRCLNSIIKQSLNDLEVILIDDGSPDNSGEICDEFAEIDDRIIVLHIYNGGVSAARNKGILAATGEHITFCDSDDYWDNEWLKSLIDCLWSFKADLVSADYSVVDENENLISVEKHVKGCFSFEKKKETIDFIIQYILSGKLGWETVTKVFLRNIVTENNIRFCENCENFAEDLGFVLEYLLYCKRVATSENSGYYYIQHENSMMHVTKNKIKLNALNEVSIQFGSRYLFEKQYADRERTFAVIHYLIMNNQYIRIIQNGKYSNVADEIKRINNIQWYKKQTKAAFKAYSVFCYYFEKKTAQKIMLQSLYCLHKNWKLHLCFSAIYYKTIYKW